jgi:hypothetical protein
MATPTASAPAADWLQERAGTRSFARTVFLRNVPLGVGGVLYTLGFAATFVFTL